MNVRPMTMARSRSKTMATWLAVVGGVLGAHRFYLHGKADPWAWLHLVGTLIGSIGVARMRHLGQDDLQRARPAHKLRRAADRLRSPLKSAPLLKMPALVKSSVRAPSRHRRIRARRELDRA